MIANKIQDCVTSALTATQEKLKKESEAFSNILPLNEREFLKCISAHHEYLIDDYIKQYRRLPLIKKNTKGLQNLLTCGVKTESSLGNVVKTYTKHFMPGILFVKFKYAADKQRSILLSSQHMTRKYFEDARCIMIKKRVDVRLQESQKWLNIIGNIVRLIEVLDSATLTEMFFNSLTMMQTSFNEMNRIQAEIEEINKVSEVDSLQFILDRFDGTKKKFKSIGHYLAGIRDADGGELLTRMTELKAEIDTLETETLLFLCERLEMKS